MQFISATIFLKQNGSGFIELAKYEMMVQADEYIWKHQILLESQFIGILVDIVMR